MSVSPHPHRGRTLLLGLVLLAACTPSVSETVADDPDVARQVLGAFIEAWRASDYQAMSALVAPGEGPRWTPDRIRRVTAEISRQGHIAGIEPAAIEATEPSGEPVAEAGETSFGYRIDYTSELFVEPIGFEGRIGLVFHEPTQTWGVRFRRSSLFPGVTDGHGFVLSARYPERAAILDRRGRNLATGRAGARRYPFGSIAGSTVGHLEPVTKKDVKLGSVHEPGDLIGGSGLEESFEDRLAGTPWLTLKVVDRAGESLEAVARSDGERSRPLRTTLDIEVQRAAERAYGSTTGGAVVLDPRTGDILAAVASSPFDPSGYRGVAGIEPFNRALSGLYPPGSSMKVMTAAAALELGEVKASTKLTGPAEYKGVRNFESGEFGSLTFAGALQHSVNTAFAQVAEDIGPKRITRFADLFGFNRSPSMALEAAEPSFPFPEDEGDLLWASIGQAQTLATPLQMATVAATIANGGKRMEPRIIIRQRPRGQRVVSRSTARTMTTLMESVVTGGTGVAARIDGVAVAGKTGTAEVDVGGERKNHAWFVSFAPAGDPKVAVAVVSEYGGIGGQVAAPLARAILVGILGLVR